MRGDSVFVSIGEYEDGTPGEVWIDTARAGSDLQVLALAAMTSLALQFGVPPAIVSRALPACVGRLLASPD